MTNEKSRQDLFKKYAFHTFLQYFAHASLMAFSALFIYAKTGSIGIVLAAQFADVFADLIVRSPLIEWWWNRLFKQKHIPAMVAGMSLAAVALLGIFSVNFSRPGAVPLLLLFSWLSSIGASTYWIPSNSFFFQAVGSSNAPGRYTSIISIVRICAAICAALASLVLNAGNHFLVLLPIMSGTIFLSLIPLRGAQLSVEGLVSWRRAMKRISVGCFFANLIGDNALQTVGIPLVLIALFGSFSTSVFVSASVLLLAGIFGYFAGTLKDHGKPAIFMIAFLGFVLIWIAYAIVKTQLGFILLGALEYIFSAIVGIGRDARTSRESANSGHSIESALAVDVARVSGYLVGLLLLLVAFLITHSIPQTVLIAGALFVIPRGIYALRAVDHLKAQTIL